MPDSGSPSAFSTHRLRGQPIPDDLAILYAHRSELKDRIGMVISDAPDWQPWADTSYLTAEDLARRDVIANLAAVQAVMNCISFVAATENHEFLGYWHGPNDTPVEYSPVVWWDNEGQFHLMLGRCFADGILNCYAYDDEDFADWKSWMEARNIAVNWSSVEQMPEPTVELTPSMFHAQLFDSELEKLPVPKPWWQFWS